MDRGRIGAVNEEIVKAAVEMLKSQISSPNPTVTAKALGHLYPTVASHVGVDKDANHNPDTTKDRRVCSDEYNGRYFTYVIPANVLLETEWEQIFSNISNPKLFRDYLLIADQEDKLIDLVARIQRTQFEIDVQIFQSFCTALIEAGEIIQETATELNENIAYVFAGMIHNGFRTSKNSEMAVNHFSAALKNTNDVLIPLLVIGELKEARISGHRDFQIMSDEEFDLITSQVLSKIRLKVITPDFLKTERLGLLLGYWIKLSSELEVKNYLTALEQSDENLLYILRAFTSTPYGSDSSVYDRIEFEHVEKYFGIDLLEDQLKNTNPSNLPSELILTLNVFLHDCERRRNGTYARRESQYSE